MNLTRSFLSIPQSFLSRSRPAHKASESSFDATPPHMNMMRSFLSIPQSFLSRSRPAHKASELIFDATLLHMKLDKVFLVHTPVVLEPLKAGPQGVRVEL